MMIETRGYDIDFDIEYLVDMILDEYFECTTAILDYVNNGDDLPFTDETIGYVIKGETLKALCKAVGEEFLRRADL